MELNSKASYIKGLFDGYELNESSKECKIIEKLIDLVVDLSKKVEELEADHQELSGYVSEMAEDLVNLEDVVYDDVEEEEYEDYSDLNEDEDFDFEEDEDYYEIECPSCGEKICFTDDIDIEELVCPACGEAVGSVSCECDGCDCTDCEGCTESCEEQGAKGNKKK